MFLSVTLTAAFTVDTSTIIFYNDFIIFIEGFIKRNTWDLKVFTVRRHQLLRYN